MLYENILYLIYSRRQLAKHSLQHVSRWENGFPRTLFELTKGIQRDVHGFIMDFANSQTKTLRDNSLLGISGHFLDVIWKINTMSYTIVVVATVSAWRKQLLLCPVFLQLDMYSYVSSAIEFSLLALLKYYIYGVELCICFDLCR